MFVYYSQGLGVDVDNDSSSSSSSSVDSSDFVQVEDIGTVSYHPGAQASRSAPAAADTTTAPAASAASAHSLQLVLNLRQTNLPDFEGP